MAEDPRTFTLTYPIRRNSDGSTTRDYTSQSQLLMLSTFDARTSLHDPGYSFPPRQYEQGPLDEDTLKYLIFALAQHKIAKYIPQLLVLKLNLLKNVLGRQLILDIIWADKVDLQQPRHAQIGLDVVNDNV